MQREEYKRLKVWEKFVKTHDINYRPILGLPAELQTSMKLRNLCL